MNSSRPGRAGSLPETPEAIQQWEYEGGFVTSSLDEQEESPEDVRLQEAPDSLREPGRAIARHKGMLKRTGLAGRE